MRPEQIARIVSEFHCFAAVPQEEWRQSEAFITRLPAQPALFQLWMHTHKELSQFIYRLFIQRMVSVTGLIGVRLGRGKLYVLRRGELERLLQVK
jgi:hypothetical protein